MPEALDFGPFLLLNDEARARLRAATTRVRFAPGDKLVREDEPADAAYALATGRVRVLAGQDLRTLATLSAPVLVGELAVLSGEPRTATVVATAMCTGVRIPAEALRSALAEDAAFAAELEEFARLRLGMNFLRLSSPFADLPSRSLDELAANLRPVRFAPGEVLLREGERGDDAFLIRVGQVEVVRGEGAQQRALSTLGPGSFVGEVSALTGGPRTATVRAKTAVQAFRLPGSPRRPTAGSSAPPTWCSLRAPSCPTPTRSRRASTGFSAGASHPSVPPSPSAWASRASRRSRACSGKHRRPTSGLAAWSSPSWAY